MPIKKISLSKKTFPILIMCLSLAAVLAGCSGAEIEAAQSVETFFQAILEKDEPLFQSTLCDEYQMIAIMDFYAFSIVETSMENFSCQAEHETGGQIEVRCQGTLHALFGDQIRDFDLSNRIFHVIEEDGKWLVCGHTDEL